jgi:hypothetical protein
MEVLVCTDVAIMAKMKQSRIGSRVAAVNLMLLEKADAAIDGDVSRILLKARQNEKPG